MGATTVQGEGIRTADERDILRRYANGDDVAAIAGSGGKRREEVGLILSRLCNYNRQRARAAVLAYDSATEMPTKRPAPQAAARSKPNPVCALRPAPDALEVPADASTDVGTDGTDPPEPEQASAITEADIPDLPPVTAPAIDIDALLKDAEGCGLPRPAAKAAAIRAQIGELAVLMASTEQERVLRALIGTLTDQRDKAIAELRELTGKDTAAVKASRPSQPAPTREECALIRGWAAENNVECPRTGRIGGRVVDAWRAATGGKG